MKSHTLPASTAAAVTPAVARYSLEIPSGHVVVSMPRAQYELAIQTLVMDSRSRSFDPVLRTEISDALASMTEHDADPTRKGARSTKEGAAA
jgi:hypothetical protein